MASSNKDLSAFKYPERPSYEEVEGIGVGEKEDTGIKFLKKSKENPFVPLGITCGLAALGYSIYNFRKSNTKLSLYLIHTRVAAQGAVVGALTIGVMYKMITEHVLKKPAATE